MIYLDNAATGGFKPYTVVETTQTVTRYLCANPGRSGHRLSITGAEIIFDCRKILGEFFNCSPKKVIFTKNCTEALNLAIFGTVKKGVHVIATVFEHNSVLRPLYQLERLGVISLDIVSPKNQDILSALSEKIKDNTYLIATTAISNVTGEVLPIKDIANFCKSKNILYLCDGAQGAGHVPLKVNDGISLLSIAGHKGLCGIMGSGALLISDDVDVSPIIFGGTGIESFNKNQPDCYPEKLESGTLSLPAIASLKEGAKYVLNNMHNFAESLYLITEKVINNLKNFPNIICYSKPNPAGIISFDVQDKDSVEIADTLNVEFDIAVRGGYHCAPLLHKFLGTEKNGLVRASFAVQNTSRETNCFLRAVYSICKA